MDLATIHKVKLAGQTRLGSCSNPSVYGPSSNPPPPESASTPGALQSAIAHLRRGLRPDGTYAGIDEWDGAEHQWRLLHEWAQDKGLILPADFTPAKAGGYEHDVRYVPETRRWLKFTKPSMAGCSVEWLDGRMQMFPATPLQYLRRWRLNNRVFADDVELVGLAETGRQLRIVISQQDLIGEAPSWEEIHLAMTTTHGLHLLNTTASVGGYEARAYAGDRFAVFDVRPANCVRTAEGDVVPFDVIPQVFSRKDALILRGLRR